jgi:hypothetical protein
MKDYVMDTGTWTIQEIDNELYCRTPGGDIKLTAAGDLESEMLTVKAPSVQVERCDELKAELRRRAEYEFPQELVREYLGQWPTFAGVERNARPESLVAKPADPLDVEYDGWTLRRLLECDKYARREVGGRPRGTMDHATPAQRAAVSAHWSAELRSKVAASAAAEAAHENRTTLDADPEDYPW